MISIIIINYNQKKFLEQCLKSIYDNFKSHPFEIILINNSPEEDLTDLQYEYNLKLVYNENRGFSQANNLAADLASGEYLFFLNADTIIKSDFFSVFADNFSGKEFGAVGIKLYNQDNTFQLSFWKENTFKNEIKNKKEEELFRKKNLKYISIKEKEYAEIKEADWVSGAAMIIKSDVFKKTGGFDERFFLFYEDADICKTLNQNGFKNYFFPFGSIIHYKGENVNENFHSNAYYYSKESQLIYYKKHNNFPNNLFLRLYLFVKFSTLYLLTFKKIHLRIIKLLFGINGR
ncbi:MAG: glycosyltransferase family 2 protein [Bacteroidota bacterium]|nr:glycosyltransferase family 2 protein [Bacteroidota bacterium]